LEVEVVAAGRRPRKLRKAQSAAAVVVAVAESMVEPLRRNVRKENLSIRKAHR
jgi:hypothetical protein